MNDIALLKVSPPFNYSKGKANGNGAVGPICLMDEDVNFEGSVTISGWGYVQENGNEPSITLQAVDLKILPPSSCHAYSFFDKGYMLCVGFEKGSKDACQV